MSSRMSGHQSLWVPRSGTPEEQTDLASVPVVSGANRPRPKLANTDKQVLNLASYDFTGLAGNETIKTCAIETFQKYGVGRCGPPGFYRTIGASLSCLCAQLLMNSFAF
jgi:7-keto-8-aminopelargonate synthetase-like enzyme